jgi:hypothetical protein
VRKLTAQLSTHIHQGVDFEIAKADLMEVNQNRDDFTQCQVPGMSASALTGDTPLSLPVRQKSVTKRIDMVEPCK